MPIHTLDLGWAKPYSVQFRRRNDTVTGTGIAYVRYGYRPSPYTGTTSFTNYFAVGNNNTTYSLAVSTNIEPGTTYRYEIYGYNSSYTYTGNAGGLIYFTTPKVTISNATNVEQTKATVNGYVNPGWYGGVYYRFKVNTTYSPFQFKSSAGNVSANITGLVANTGYTVSLYIYETASSATEIGYSDYSAYFTTKAADTPPTVTTQAASSVGENGARLNATINSMGTYSSVWGDFEYRKGTIGTWLYEEGSSHSSTGNYSILKYGLSSDSLYQFRAVLEYAGGKVYGSILNFTTTKAEASVQTNAASSVNITSATLNGQVTSMGDYSQVSCNFGFRKSGGSWFTSFPNTTRYSAGSFNYSATSLDSNTTYEFKAQVWNGSLMDTGSTLTFTTLKQDASVQTNAASGISGTFATLNGQVTNMGDHSSVSCNFQFRKSGGTWFTSSPNTIRYSAGSFNHGATGLDYGTTYEFKAQVWDGGTLMDTGSTLTFTTSAKIDASVQTNAATSVDVTTATLNGQVTSMGDYDEVSCNFDFRKSGGSWSTTSPNTLRYSAGTFSFGLTLLDPDTTYEFKAQVWNGSLMDTGSTLYFTTEKDILYPIKYWSGASWQEVDRDKLKFRVGSTWVGDQKIKVRIGSSWVEV